MQWFICHIQNILDSHLYFVVKESNIYLITFGDKLRMHRVSQDISQQQLAYETGLSREYINRIENGKVNISLINVIALANVLQIKVTLLLDFDTKTTWLPK